ncbi:ABC transporter ATP-binding protein [Stappia sp. BW2]|jgi:spermidine/putrescine transport system ATP-binding protein|uniref:ABC transporter ATP-binding protein n=1 Tax=Stappia sp. BW2 TaxID=2592622 RepID=UPI0011DE6D2D|nr:ABC transporter ATP-binding protein [Stappia sp. BW2]TYC63059.1 ABC transporter ATP-binding protein [Stappia sp. BW2]
MNTTSAIRLDGLCKTYGVEPVAVHAVKDVSIEIRHNEFFTLLGPSGCGKTSLLRLIGGFEFPTSGSIHLNDEQVGGMPPYMRSINTVFQSYALFPHMTVEQNVRFGLRMKRYPRNKTNDRVREMLELVKLDHLAKRHVDALSGGQQQRVALARALAPEPKVLLLDESLSALDYKLRKEMQVELKALQAQTGITFIFVTHDQEEALSMSDRIAVLSSGEIVQIGTPREIYDRPANRFVASFIGDTNFLPATVGERSGVHVSVKIPGLGTVEVREPDIDIETGEATAAIRPEKVRILQADSQSSGPKATVKLVTYNGMDTFYTLVLSDGGEELKVRQQNLDGAETDFKKGALVTLELLPNAVRLLWD